MPVNPYIVKKYGNAGGTIVRTGPSWNSAIGSGVAAALGTAGWGANRGNGGAPSLSNRQQMATKRGRSYTRVMKKPRRKSYASSSTLKKKIMATKPAKHLMYSAGISFSIGQVHVWSPTQSVIRGVNDSDRIGDTINLCNLKWNGVINGAKEANAYMFRMLIGYTGEEFAANTWTTNITSGQVFQSNTTSGFLTNGIVNPKAFTVLYDQKFTINSLIADVRDVLPVTGSLSFNNHNFVYQADGATYGKNKNLVVLMIGDKLRGPLAVGDDFGFTVAFDFCFKS